MKETFDRCQPWVLAHEGGYVDHPEDPGGATNRGITQRTYNAWRREQGHETRSVRQIAESEIDAIYRGEYWAAVSADRLPAGIDYAIYDYGIHSGPARATKELQRAVGVSPDGVIGPITLAAARDHDPDEVIVAVCARRMRFLRGLKHWSTFATGWTRRVEGDHTGLQMTDSGVLDRAVSLVDGTHETMSQPRDLDDGAGAKAPETDRGALARLVAAVTTFFQLLTGGIAHA